MIAKALGGFKAGSERFCVATPGSDGRLEKGTASQLDAVIYHDGLDKKSLRSLAFILSDVLNEERCPILSGEVVEDKNIREGSMIYFNRNPRMVFPSRVLDSFLLYGDESVLAMAKRKMLDELEGREGKRALTEIGNRKQKARRLMQSGQQSWRGEMLTHFDLDTGIAYYKTVEAGGSQAHLRGFKHGPLRYVQIAMEQAVVSMARVLMGQGKKDDANSVIAEVPTPTVAKIEFISRHGKSKLGAAEVADLTDCYLAFLQLHHQSEELSKEGITELNFDVAEAKDRADAIHRVLGGGIVR